MNLLVANWKMAPDTQAQVATLAKATAVLARTYKKTVEVVVCASSIHLATVAKGAKTLVLGAQNVSAVAIGAATGQISASMLKAYGVQYCIVGHSESRADGESNELIKQKIERLLEKKIQPILCVGEKERDSQGWYLSGIKDQIETALSGVPKATIKRFVIAYEPVWAIGVQAEREATPAECHEMVIFIRKLITDLYDEKTAQAVSILYGGSVNEQNAKAFVSEGGAQGLLIGRTSLDPKRFTALAKTL